MSFIARYVYTYKEFVFVTEASTKPETNEILHGTETKTKFNFIVRTESKI